MAETEQNQTGAKPDIVTMPHGQQQQIKMELVDMIHSGASPYDILLHVVKWLEEASGERGYAQYVEEQIRAVYGCALGEAKPLADELAEVKSRLQRIEAAYQRPDFSEEEHIRIGFAIERHKKKIAQLEEMIRQAEN